MNNKTKSVLGFGGGFIAFSVFAYSSVYHFYAETFYLLRSGAVNTFFVSFFGHPFSFRIFLF
jgi:predicted GNAT superfamily acetyltransferase